MLAKNETDVVNTVLFCHQNKIPIVPRGAGTGLSGGCVPVAGSIIISTEKLQELEINPQAKTAIVEPGVITKTLLDQAGEYYLTYPPDPASYEESTIGGNIAENAGGLRCKRFGVTKDYVIGLRGVTVCGEIIETGIFNKQRGFSLGDIFIGSEGTLIIITKIAVRLIEKPEIGDTILVAFDNPGKAARSVSDINKAGIILTVMEYLDGDAASCSNKYEKTDGLDNAEGILLLETPAENRDKITDMIKVICENNGCSHLMIEKDPVKAQQLWKIRRNMSKAVEEIAVYRISEDVAVPNSQFPVMVSFVNDMNKTGKIRMNAYGHAGDGNLHVNFIAMTGNDDEVIEIERGIEILLKKAIEFGGTLSGEHGIGLAKKKYLSLEYDPATLNTMRKIKTIFDPENLLNPEKIF